MNLKLLLFITTWLLCFTSIHSQTATAPSSGDGSEDNPYQIATLENLYWLSQDSSLWNANFIQTANIDATETQEWDEGLGFSPIGNGDANFTGYYNGQSYLINNLSIYRPDNNNIGLFGYASGAEIDSLGLINCSVTGKNRVGSLVGYIEESKLANCYNTGAVSGNSDVGGVIGGCNGYFCAESTVSNCYNKGAVSGNSDVGGVIGSCGFVVDSETTVTNCYNTGPVTSITGSAGGVVASCKNTTILYSYNTGVVFGGGRTGGVVGLFYGATVEYCYNSGNIKGTTNVGGVVGASLAGREYHGYYLEVTSLKVWECYNTGAVSGTNNVGGLVGYSSGELNYHSNSYSSNVSKGYSTGAVYGESNVGNVVGVSANVRSYINKCYYNYETSKDTSGVGYGVADFYDYYGEYWEVDYVDRTIGLTTDEMRQSSSFESLDFSSDTVWGIIENKTYPAIKALNNAPFAIPDTLSNGSYSMSLLLENDYDYETLQQNLTYRVDSAVFEDDDFDYGNYLTSIEEGDSLKIVYRVGEIRAEQNDILWGNQATSYFVYTDTTQISETYETDEETSVYVPSLTNLLEAKKSGALNMEITYPVNGYITYDNDSVFYVPNTDFYGTDSAIIHFTNLNIDLYTKTYFVVNNVNDAPEITSTALTVGTENILYTYNLIAEDLDGDVLTYSLSNAPEGMSIDTEGVITWIPASGVTTSGEVTAIVSDGELSDSEVFTVSVDTDGTTTIKNTKQSEVQIYPNPVQTSFYVSGVSGMAELSVYNALGGLVKYVSSVETGSSVDVTELSDGIYVVKVKDENGVSTTKINKM